MNKENKNNKNKVIFRANEDLIIDLKSKSEKAGLSESELGRECVSNSLNELDKPKSEFSKRIKILSESANDRKTK